jgi:hypothetical protein
VKDVFDESSIEPNMSKETTDAFNIGGRWKLLYNFNLCLIHLNPTLRYKVSENNSFSYHKMAFFLVQDEILLTTPL